MTIIHNDQIQYVLKFMQEYTGYVLYKNWEGAHFTDSDAIKRMEGAIPHGVSESLSIQYRPMGELKKLSVHINKNQVIQLKAQGGLGKAQGLHFLSLLPLSLNYFLSVSTSTTRGRTLKMAPRFLPAEHTRFPALAWGGDWR